MDTAFEKIIGFIKIDSVFDEKYDETVQLGSDTYIISVYDNEGDFIPHFHIYNDKVGKKRVDSCLYIFLNRYFIHGSHDTTVNNNVLDHLNNWLKDKNKIDPTKTNWQMIIFQWNRINPPDTKSLDKNKYPGLSNKFKDLIQPDYTTINDDLMNKEVTVYVTDIHDNCGIGTVISRNYKNHPIILPCYNDKIRVQVKANLIAILNEIFTTNDMWIGNAKIGSKFCIKKENLNEESMKSLINFDKYDRVQYIDLND